MTGRELHMNEAALDGSMIPCFHEEKKMILIFNTVLYPCYHYILYNVPC
jgi:hypothetical protein